MSILDGGPVQDGRRSHEPASEGADHQRLAIFQFTGSGELVDQDADAGRGRVAIFLNIGRKFLPGLLQVLADALNDAHVRLMEQIFVDVRSGQSVALKQDVHIVDAGFNGNAEHFAAFHHQRRGSFLHAVERRRLEGAFVIHHVGMRNAGQAEIAEALAFGNHHRRSAVSEQHRGCPVVPVAETGRLLGRYDQDVPGAAGLKERISYVERIDQPGASAVQVERRADAAQRTEQDAAQRGGHIAVGHIRANQIIDFRGLQSGGCKGGLRSLGGQFAQCLGTQKPPRMDAGARRDPAVAGFQETCQHVVGDLLLGKRTACSYDFHIGEYSLKFVHLGQNF